MTAESCFENKHHTFSSPITAVTSKLINPAKSPPDQLGEVSNITVFREL